MPVYAADTPNQTKPDKAQKPESKNGGWKRARNLVIPSMCRKVHQAFISDLRHGFDRGWIFPCVLHLVTADIQWHAGSLPQLNS